MQSIICVGDTNFILKYYLEDNYWQFLQYDDKKTTFNGGLRYSSLATLPNQKLILTGGCHIQSEDATNLCLEINGANISMNTKLKNMHKKRYAHCSIYLNGCVYVMGGFDHKDNNKSPPSTLKSCEKYIITDNKWVPTASMNHARSFFGCALVNKESIFVFGGFFDDQILSSIEKFDYISETWVTHFIKLPEKLAKIGVVYYKDHIIILGGINGAYDIIKSVRVLDVMSTEWHKITDMLYPRTFNQSACLYNNFIYAIGGNADCNCERYDFYSNKWQLIESYTSVLKSKKMNELYNFSFAPNFLGSS